MGPLPNGIATKWGLPITTPLKSNIATQNSHVWKEIYLPNHHFGCPSQFCVFFFWDDPPSTEVPAAASLSTPKTMCWEPRSKQAAALERSSGGTNHFLQVIFLEGSWQGGFWMEKKMTLPETNSKGTWKMDGWNTILSYWGGLAFQGLLLLVSGRVNDSILCDMPECWVRGVMSWNAKLCGKWRLPYPEFTNMMAGKWPKF